MSIEFPDRRGKMGGDIPRCQFHPFIVQIWNVIGQARIDARAGRPQKAAEALDREAVEVRDGLPRVRRLVDDDWEFNRYNATRKEISATRLFLHAAKDDPACKAVANELREVEEALDSVERALNAAAKLATKRPPGWAKREDAGPRAASFDLPDGMQKPTTQDYHDMIANAK